MQVISSFRDYYDYVAHLYGGGDPRTPYRRRAFLNEESVLQAKTQWNAEERGHADIEVMLPLGMLQVNVFQRERPIHESSDYYKGIGRGLSVCGRCYQLYAPTDPENEYLGFKPQDFDAMLRVSVDPRWYMKRRNLSERKTIAQYIAEEKAAKKELLVNPARIEGFQSEALIYVSRQIKAPVFTFTTKTDKDQRDIVVVDPKVPMLQAYGMNELFPPEMLYQELAYYVANTINESPDVQPAGKPPMSDKEKITSHGFDLKQSFRHRKEPIWSPSQPNANAGGLRKT